MLCIAQGNTFTGTLTQHVHNTVAPVCAGMAQCTSSSPDSGLHHSDGAHPLRTCDAQQCSSQETVGKRQQQRDSSKETAVKRQVRTSGGPPLERRIDPCQSLISSMVKYAGSRRRGGSLGPMEAFRALGPSPTATPHPEILASPSIASGHTHQFHQHTTQHVLHADRGF